MECDMCKHSHRYLIQLIWRFRHAEISFNATGQKFFNQETVAHMVGMSLRHARFISIFHRSG